MKYTGIVRRLDSLGRIVIPREYRKMHKIKESDPLEIIALENGEILIKKVDLTAQLISAGAPIVDGVFEATGLCAMLSDGEKFLSGAGMQKSMLADTVLPNKVKSLIEDRKSYCGGGSDIGLDGGFVCVMPVFCQDVFGALYVFSPSAVSKEDERLLKTVAKILGQTMQKY